MPSPAYYREQANLFLQMALACVHPEQAANYEAQARMFLNLASHPHEQALDLNSLLAEFNDRQLRKD